MHDIMQGMFWVQIEVWIKSYNKVIMHFNNDMINKSNQHIFFHYFNSLTKFNFFKLWFVSQFIIIDFIRNIIISAVKWLIAYKIKASVYIVYVCIFIKCIYKYTHIQYILGKY